MSLAAIRDHLIGNRVIADVHKELGVEPREAPARFFPGAMPCASGQGLDRVSVPRSPTGKRNGRYRHGGRTMAALAERRAIGKLIREARASLADLE